MTALFGQQFDEFVGDLIAGSASCETLKILTGLRPSMEEHHGIEIPDEEAEKIKNVGDALRYIGNHTS